MKVGPATKFGKGPLRMEELWLQGWHCSVASEVFEALSWKSGLDAEVLLDRGLSPAVRIQELCSFVDRFELPMSEIDGMEFCGKDKVSSSSAPTSSSSGSSNADDSSGTPAGDSSAGRTANAVRGKNKNLGDPTDPGTDTSLFDVIETNAAERPMLFLRDVDVSNPQNEIGKKYLLEANNRGRCLDDLGVCECFVPYRGRFCENEETLASFLHKPYKAALHYLVGDVPRLLRDMRTSLRILWRNFNRFHDYPVVVFHDGLSENSRQLLIEASFNKLWFALVDDYTAIPKHLLDKLPQNDFAGYPLGYRGMCRFRSGPIFQHPILAKFEYAWTLDTDGYFPAPLRVKASNGGIVVDHDPIGEMHATGTVYSYSHISRDQASQVQHFWEFTRLYLEHRGIDPKRSKLMRRLTDALVMRDTYWHEWNRLLFMNDIELVRLSWFRGEAYQDYFRFLDSLGGFWLYRWGDHGIRTIGIALHMEEAKVSQLRVPYSHQGACVCAIASTATASEASEENTARGTSALTAVAQKCVKRKDGQNLIADAPRDVVEDHVSRSFKFECQRLRDGETLREEDQRWGVVDEQRFWGGE